MAHFFARLRRDPRCQATVAVAALLIVGSFISLASMADGPSDHDPTEHFHVVQYEAFSVSLSFSGRVVPGERIDVITPFDASVISLDFAYGDQIEAGQVLMRLDPADVAQSLVEAESNWIKAEEEAAKLEHWAQGSEMRRAARAVAAAESDLQDLDLKLAETKALLDRGLVPRSEYDGLLQQRRQREAALIASREDLAHTSGKGQGSHRRMAFAQRDVARARYDAVRRGGGDTINAPSAGIIVRPDTHNESGRLMVNAGGRITKGQPLGVIASTEGLDVVFSLDEADLNAVSVGQRAIVTGPGFGGLNVGGQIVGIAGEAEAAVGTPKATFLARVRLDPLSNEAAGYIRIGMTAFVSVTVYENLSALTVPPEAIQGSTPNAWVKVRPRANEAAERRPVSLGKISASAVEIVSGVELGDRVVWNSVTPTSLIEQTTR